MIELPDIEHPDFAPFWEGCAAGELRIPECENGHRFWPPRPVCPACLAALAGWPAVAPEGALFTWTVVHRTRLAGFEERTPYVIALVTLRDLPSVRLLARCEVGSDGLEPGLELTLRFLPVSGELVLPQWALPIE